MNIAMIARILVTGFFVLLFGNLSAAVEVSKELEGFTGPKMFGEVAEFVEQYLPTFRLMTIPILAGALMGAIKNSNNLGDLSQRFADILLVFGFAMASIPLVNLTLDTVDGLTNELGTHPYTMMSRLWEYNKKFNSAIWEGVSVAESMGDLEMGIETEGQVDISGEDYSGMRQALEKIVSAGPDENPPPLPDSDVIDPTPEEELGFLRGAAKWASDKVDAAGNAVKGAVTGLADAFNNALKKLVGILTRLTTSLVLTFVMAFMAGTIFNTIIIVFLMDSMRYLLLYLGVLLLPIAISAMATQTFRQQGFTYVMGFISLALWPFGWALGHLGTLALFSMLAGRMQAVGEAVSNSAIGASITANAGVAATQGYLGAQGIGVMIASGGVAALFKIALLAGALILLFLVIWIWVVTVLAPFAVGRFVKGGGMFFSEMGQGASQMTARVIGSALTMGAFSGLLGGMGGGGGLLGGTGGATGAGAGAGGPQGVSGGGDPTGIGATGQSEGISGGSAPTGGGGSGGGMLPGTGGGSPSGGTQTGGSGRPKAGGGPRFSLGKAVGATLRNAARYDGSPTSAAHILDASWDENREYGSQEAMIEISNSMKENSAMMREMLRSQRPPKG